MLKSSFSIFIQYTVFDLWRQNDEFKKRTLLYLLCTVNIVRKTEKLQIHCTSLQINWLERHFRRSSCTSSVIFQSAEPQQAQCSSTDCVERFSFFSSLCVSEWTCFGSVVTRSFKGVCFIENCNALSTQRSVITVHIFEPAIKDDVGIPDVS